VHVILDNVSKRNALSGRMMTELAETVEHLEEWNDGFGVVLTGAGGTFCSGADLGVVAETLNKTDHGAEDDDSGIHFGPRMCEFMQHYLERWRSMGIVSVAAIEGSAVGGGTELALACDYRIMSHDAHFRMVHTKMGLVPGWGGGVKLAQLCSRGDALRILAGGERLTAESAHRVGVVDRTCPPGGAAAAAEDLLAGFSNGAIDAVCASKRVIAACEAASAAEALNVEAREFRRLWGGPSNVAALERALQKGRGK
jgi:ethylmalonyl-CoA/methylmalonyl-CoA decarboxylase